MSNWALETLLESSAAPLNVRTDEEGLCWMKAMTGTTALSISGATAMKPGIYAVFLEGGVATERVVARCTADGLGTGFPAEATLLTSAAVCAWRADAPFVLIAVTAAKPYIEVRLAAAGTKNILAFKVA